MESIENTVLIPSCSEARQIYFGLLCDEPDKVVVERSRSYLVELLQMAARNEADLPSNPDGLATWSTANAVNVGAQYREYLDARKAGGARRYFGTKSHALYFLRSVAPTKLVDGVWLYGLLRHWGDTRFSPLIQTYLEELGRGLPDKNHVVIYKKLLAAHGCEQWDTLSDDHFVQGTIQLALAQHAANFLPEVIGFNLGYEQLPLHLLICAYELNEVGIDPYYFTLHIGVDNVVSGHGAKAIQGLFDALPHIADKRNFYQRVVNGYKLNSMGTGTNSVIAQFDLYKELVSILAAKCCVGAHLHSDYGRIAGKSVNQWLSDSAQIPAFLDSLQQTGWIKRHQDPEHSRFWNLIQGEHAEMFGVFNTYERQVIADWIAGDSIQGQTRHPLSYKDRRYLYNVLPARKDPSYMREGAESCDDFNMELRLLETNLGDLSDKDSTMATLVKIMSPVHHHTDVGLMATRVFTRLLDNG
jgi:hypothetical protein